MHIAYKTVAIDWKQKQQGYDEKLSEAKYMSTETI
jgi:hypothetical protein